MLWLFFSSVYFKSEGDWGIVQKMNLSSLSCLISGSTISELIGHKGSSTKTILKNSFISENTEPPLELFFIEKLTSSFSGKL